MTDAGAIDTDLGVLKTGKEADVLLLERASTDGSGQRALMAAKRYRGEKHRQFHRSGAYTEGRRQKKSRDTRALTRKSRYGCSVAAGQWAYAEREALTTCWEADLPVPHPVQIDGTELLLKFIGTPDGVAAPRLAAVRADPETLSSCWEQVRQIVLGFAQHGGAHGDLSPYNLLVNDDGRVVVIDLSQVVDVIGNPRGPALLHRDCVNATSWFTSRGLAVDAEELFAEAVALAL